MSALKAAIFCIAIVMVRTVCAMDRQQFELPFVSGHIYEIVNPNGDCIEQVPVIRIRKSSDSLDHLIKLNLFEFWRVMGDNGERNGVSTNPMPLNEDSAAFHQFLRVSGGRELDLVAHWNYPVHSNASGHANLCLQSLLDASITNRRNRRESIPPVSSRRALVRLINQQACSLQSPLSQGSYRVTPRMAPHW